MPNEKTYAEQIEDGKQFVRETLTELATELKRPDINAFEFMITERDFDSEKVSIYDPAKRRVVTKLGRHDLADCSTTPSVRNALRRRVDADVRSYSAFRYA